ncbi:hypothetical protein LTR46_003152 [Exophiala xenobiotica]|nr:hypothetical protein LTR46_003152 [Exophiala xenobiotica]
MSALKMHTSTGLFDTYTYTYSSWQSSETKSNTIFVLFLTIVILAHSIWTRCFLNHKDIPNEFWYRVPQSSGVRAIAKQKEEDGRNIAHVFEKKQLDIVVFWGSQSGRGEVLARRLAKSFHDSFGLKTLAANLDDYDHKYLTQLSEKHVCGFVLSTYGDGDPPDDVTGLWNVLRTLQSTDSSLKSFRYLIFGLGNSNYRQYNQVAAYADGVFQNLGAVRFGPPGQGDEANGETESHFLAWRRMIENELKVKWHLTEKPHAHQAMFEIEEVPSMAMEKVNLGEPDSSVLGRNRSGDAGVSKALTISKARKLWETGDRLCIHMDLELGDTRAVKYKTGDHLAVYPNNPNHQVERLLSALGLSEKQDVPLVIEATQDNSDNKVPVPSPTTAQALFRHHLEICGHISMETVAALAEFAPSEAAAAELQRISHDAHIFRSEVLDAHLTFADLLVKVEEGASWAIPLSFFLERLKAMQPRYYSVCSAAETEPRTVSIVAVVGKHPEDAKSQKSLHNGCYGLATSYLHALESAINNSTSDIASCDVPSFTFDGPRGQLSGQKMFAWIRQSTFKLPMRASVPIIMVGAGTGVAPFRAFVRERMRRKEVGQEVGKMLLFLGFRHSEVDFIYREEWEEARNTLGKEVFNYRTAFSRDNYQKVYVQDRLQEQAQEVMDLLQNQLSCRFYICGSASMARQVVEALAKMRSLYAEETATQAMAWVRKLRQSKQLLEDVWS